MGTDTQLARAIDLLQQIEPLFISLTEETPRTFYPYGSRWWIAEQSSLTTFAGSPAPIGISKYPDVSPRAVYRVLRSMFPGDGGFRAECARFCGTVLGSHITPKRRIPVHASAIWSHGYLVALYESNKHPAQVLKASLKGARGANTLRNEVESMRRASAIASKGEGSRIRVPEILHAQLDGNTPFFVQEAVYGQTLQQCKGRYRRDALEDLMGFLQNLHREDLSFERTSDVYPSLFTWREQLANAREVLPSGLLARCYAVLENAQSIIESNKRVPVATAHGDLNDGNVGIDPTGNIHIIDWGNSRRRPVVDDLGRFTTAAYHKYTRAKALELLTQYSAAADLPIHNVAEQKMLSNVRKLLSLLRSLTQSAQDRKYGKRTSDHQVITCVRKVCRLANRSKPRNCKVYQSAE